MKTVKEIAVKLENKPGVLSEISELLGANGINIIALTVRTEGPIGTLSFVATDPTRVSEYTRERGLCSHGAGNYRCRNASSSRRTERSAETLETCWGQRGVSVCVHRSSRSW